MSKKPGKGALNTSYILNPEWTVMSYDLNHPLKLTERGFWEEINENSY